MGRDQAIAHGMVSFLIAKAVVFIHCVVLHLPASTANFAALGSIVSFWGLTFFLMIREFRPKKR